MDSLCEKCWYNTYDDESDESFCTLILDEDEYVRFMNQMDKPCRYFRPDRGEYDIVKKQN